MICIILTRGKVTWIDDEDSTLAQMKWYAFFSGRNWYARRTVQKEGKAEKEFLHRVIAKTPKGLDTDHLNGDTLDNRRCNLRACTRQENIRNQAAKKSNTSGYKGVNKSGRKWQARIRVKGARLTLGNFETREAARDAYLTAEKKLYGTLNRPKRI